MALTTGVYTWCTGRLTPGLLSVILPVLSVEGFLLTFVPLSLLYRTESVLTELEKSRDSFRSAFAGIACIVIITGGLVQYWICVIIVAVMIPIEVFTVETPKQTELKE